MRIYYDTEFIEDGNTIDLVSIGLVKDNGEEYYAVSDSFSWRKFRKNKWLMENVLPGLPRLYGDERNARPRVLINKAHNSVKPRWKIQEEVRDFILSTTNPELWAWYGAYDHVALCQLWGSMIDLPKGIPMWTNDLKQEHVRLGSPELPKQLYGNHNSLHDARYNRTVARYLSRFTENVIKEE